MSELQRFEVVMGVRAWILAPDAALAEEYVQQVLSYLGYPMIQHSEAVMANHNRVTAIDAGKEWKDR